MTNLKDIKTQNNDILNEFKYFAITGYSVESVDFNNDKVTLIRHLQKTNHPFSLVNYKSNKLHLVSMSTEKPMSSTTALSNSIPAESAINSESYGEYIKGINAEEFEEYKQLTIQLQKLGAKEFDEKAQLLFTHFKNVSDEFKSRLQTHLKKFREVLINAELCNKEFLLDELKELSAPTKSKTNEKPQMEMTE